MSNPLIKLNQSRKSEKPNVEIILNNLSESLNKRIKFFAKIQIMVRQTSQSVLKKALKYIILQKQNEQQRITSEQELIETLTVEKTLSKQYKQHFTNFCVNIIEKLKEDFEIKVEKHYVNLTKILMNFFESENNDHYKAKIFETSIKFNFFFKIEFYIETLKIVVQYIRINYKDTLKDLGNQIIQKLKKFDDEDKNPKEIIKIIQPEAISKQFKTKLMLFRKTNYIKFPFKNSNQFLPFDSEAANIRKSQQKNSSQTELKKYFIQHSFENIPIPNSTVRQPSYLQKKFNISKRYKKSQSGLMVSELKNSNLEQAVEKSYYIPKNELSRTTRALSLKTYIEEKMHSSTKKKNTENINREEQDLKLIKFLKSNRYAKVYHEFLDAFFDKLELYYKITGLEDLDIQCIQRRKRNLGEKYITWNEDSMDKLYLYKINQNIDILNSISLYQYYSKIYLIKQSKNSPSKTYPLKIIEYQLKTNSNTKPLRTFSQNRKNMQHFFRQTMHS